MKVDLRKAYYSSHWDFIRDLLEGMEFPKKFTDWIMVCVTSPSFTLSVNGSLCGFFQGKKGIRQGDPMPPLLFVLATEYFTR